MRTARLVETLMALDAALETKRLEDDLRRAEIKQLERDLKDRARALDDRAAQLEDNARRIRDFCEAMGLNHDALVGRS
jgi:hypothetical protein